MSRKLPVIKLTVLSIFIFLLSIQAEAQRRITGITRDQKNDPLAGVTVSEKGTNNVTMSKENGEFSIGVTSANPVLVFTYTGYLPQELRVGNQTRMNVSLSVSTRQMDEVIVIGYGKQRKLVTTGATAAIGTKELVQSPVANISNSLVGRLPGLFATQGSGEPGNDQSRILIRGIGTFSGNQGPLILVDGIQVDNYNNIDPNEIESINILKDASATAVYGIRGANGVIIISTKRGKTGVPTLSYTYNTAINSFTGIRDQMNSYDYANSFNQALKNDTYVTSGVYTPRFSEADLAKYKSGEDPVFYPNVDWYDLMLKKFALQQQHNLSIRGGTEKVKYFVSAGAFTQEGLFKNTTLSPGFDGQIHYKRYNFRSNLDFDVNKRFRVALDMSAQIENRSGNNADTRSIINYLAAANPLITPGIVDGRIVSLSASASGNPYASLLGAGYKSDYRNLLNGSVRLEHDLDFITKGLSTHALVAYQNYNRQLNTYYRPLVIHQVKRMPDNSIDFIQLGDFAAFNYSSSYPARSRRTTLEYGLDYKRSFGSHNFSALALYNQQKTQDPAFAFGVPNGYQGLVGRVTYDYKGRYLADVNMAYNGTENFAPGQRFGFFPSFSLGWVVSSEKFFPRNNILSFLKIRGSYGEVGNDQLSSDYLYDPNSRFLYRPTAFSPTGSYSAAGSYYWGVVGSNYASYAAIREGRTYNPFLTWERAKKSNIGVDATFWNGKISVTADVFQEDRANILAVPQTVSGLVGTALAAQNLGKMSNKGFEVDLTYRNHFNKFNYWLKGNYSFARNKVIFKDEINRAYAYQYETGQRAGQVFGLVAEGFYNTWEEVNDAKRPVSTYVGNNKLQPGDIKYRDVNGDGIINFLDNVPIGYSNTPEVIFGVSLGGSIGGFDFSALLQGATNVSITYSRRANQAFFDVDPAAAPNYLLESWTQERYQQGLPINFPRFAVGNGANSFTHNYQNSTFWTRDASYLRLKNVEVGYTVRGALLQKIRMKSARIYLNGNNLITWSDVFPGIDPETPNLGANLEPYPLVRTINAGININF